jgi:RNA polymerase sigma-70 factor, ECF subfamily
VDESTIEEWFLKYEKDITNFLSYYIGTADIEDFVQETFVIALNKFSLYKGKSQPKTWLISIARNIVIDRYRKRKVWEKIKYFFVPDQDFSNQLEQTSMKNFENIQLYKAVHELPSHFKEIIILRGILELSSKETSCILNCSPNKANVLYHRALKKLRTILEKEGFNHERYTNYSG